MSSMLQLVRNENMKIYKRSGTWVMIGLLILTVFAGGLFNKYVSSTNDQQQNWQVQLQGENEHLRKQIEKIESMPMAESGIKQIKQQIAINEYRIQHDIPPVEDKTLWGFMTSAPSFTGIAALFTIVIAASIVASEFSWGTIKLLLIRPVSRSKILLSKFIATLLFALFLLVFMFVSSFIIGVILFGFTGVELPYLAYSGGQVVEYNMVSYILTLYGLKSIDLIMMVTFAFMISTVFRSSSLAIGLSLFLMFTGQQIVQLLSRYDWSKYILFANTNLQQYMSGTPLVEGMTMTFSVIVLLVYFVIFTTISWTVFQKRDVAA
ncbi:ABC transporter permease subunit [Bacillus tianshenii]|nr:ABC transporter permease subunit [Bacillus tianshenii]